MERSTTSLLTRFSRIQHRQSRGVLVASPAVLDASDAVRRHPRRHAAVRTDEYVYAQLIPYIGNKRKLLPLIARAIDATGTPVGATFVDLFSGSTVVARLAKTLGLR